ncbi:MAG TPA: SusC/RagA family TonB-linked outer membrane protein [Lacibacter sp.]|nr:SusC/RagA family TonB-linked outer membrane protein [Lacibacter sp.]
MRKKLSLLTGMLVLCVQLALAQTVDVSGKVTDDKGNPITGATVQERGTRNGTTTDQSGSFKLAVKSGATLQISFVGYDTKTIATGSGGTMNVVLSQSEQSLSEVVVTGVGAATSRKKIGIDVSTVSSKNFAKSAILSPDQALVGQIAGAQIQLTSGQPGAGASIILRGINSLGSTQPMILVDGIEVTDINGLDPANIERVEVVKGAAGGTLYGAQGANGVIQIFTKRGAKGSKPNITFSSRYSSDQVIRENDLLAKNHHYVTNAQGFVLDAGGNPIRRNPVTGQWTDPAFEASNPNNNKPYREQTYDHMDQAFRTARTLNNVFNVSGGFGKFDYNFGLNNLSQQSVLFNKFTRNNISLGLGFELAKGLTARTSSQLILQEEDLLSVDRFAMINSYQWIDFNSRDSIGNLVIQPKQLNERNPLSELEWHDRYSKTNRFVQNFNVNYKLNRFVELDWKYGIDLSNREFNDVYKNQEGLLQNQFWGLSRKGSITSQYDKNQWQNMLTSVFIRTDFEKDFRLKIPIRTTTQASYDWRRNDYNYFFAQGTELPPFPPSNISVAAQKNSGDYREAFNTFGFLINQSIDWGNLFGIAVGIRSDFSSEFGGPEKKPFTFPRGNVYFRPSELLNVSWLSDWKLRAAYGEAGIQPPRFSRQVTLAPAQLGNANSLNLQGNARNPNLRVQLSKEFEVGTDVTFITGKKEWFSRISAGFTYWQRKGEDIIQNADASPSTGFSSRIDNLINTEGRGFDFQLDATVLDKKNITWNFGIRAGRAVTEITKLSNDKEVISGNFTLRPGERVGVFWGQVPLSSLDEVRPNGTPYLTAAQKANYEVVNGIVVHKTTRSALISASDDKRFMGDPNPDFTASFINSFNLFKKLSVSFQFDWWKGHQVYNLTRQWLYRDRLHADFDQQVTINGQSGAWAQFYNSLYNSVQPISWFVEDASFVRLRDVSISYTIGPDVLGKTKFFNSITILASGRNLLTFSDYTGLDPEVSSRTSTGFGRGEDNFGFPNLKSYQVGLTFGF